MEQIHEGSAKQLRLIVADDYTLFRECVVDICDVESGLHVVGQAGSAVDTLSLVRRARPDVVLLGNDLPDQEPIELLSRVLGAPSAPRVVVLGPHDNARSVRQSMACGAHGYVSRRATRAELIAVVRAVGTGRDHVLLSLPATAVNRLGDAPYGPLSARELEVLDLVAQGCSNAQVGDRLSIRTGTVKRHLNNIYAKFGVHSRTNAINRAAALQIL